MTQSTTRRLRLDRPLDLVATVGAGKVVRHNPGYRSGPDGVWRGLRTPDGPATVRLTVDGDELVGEAWGAGAGWLLDRLGDLTGAGDRAEGFEPRHRVVRDMHLRNPGMRIGRTGLVWETLAPAILAQKVTGKESSRSWRVLTRRYGEPAPGPAPLGIVPRPDVIGALDYTEFHTAGVERRRAETLRRAARAARRMQETVDMTPADARRRLTALPGVGPWTAAVVAGEALGDPDAIPVGDYHIPNTVVWALAGEPRGTDERMLEVLAGYEGHRLRVLRLLGRAGISAPRYGPRAPLRDITRI